MKAAYGAVLVLAGVAGGVALMKLMPARHEEPKPAIVAQAPAPQPTPAPLPAAEPAATPAPAAPLAETAKPAPAAKKSAAARPSSRPKGEPEPLAVAEYRPAPAPAAPVSAPEPTPVPAPPAARPVEPVAPAPPPPPNKVTLNAGLTLPVRLVDGLSTERNHAGDAFLATLDKELVVDGFVIAERGARLEGKVLESLDSGKVKGVASLKVAITRLHTSDGQSIPIQTQPVERAAQQERGKDAAKVGAVAGIGAIIGAIAGGGKGAAIGAGAGAGAGTAGVLLTKGQPATLPSETRLSFVLAAPAIITERK